MLIEFPEGRGTPAHWTLKACQCSEAFRTAGSSLKCHDFLHRPRSLATHCKQKFFHLNTMNELFWTFARSPTLSRERFLPFSQCVFDFKRELHFAIEKRTSRALVWTWSSTSFSLQRAFSPITPSGLINRCAKSFFRQAAPLKLANGNCVRSVSIRFAELDWVSSALTSFSWMIIRDDSRLWSIAFRLSQQQVSRGRFMALPFLCSRVWRTRGCVKQRWW